MEAIHKIRDNEQICNTTIKVLHIININQISTSYKMKILKYILISVLNLFVFSSILQAQIAKKNGVTLEEVGAVLNALGNSKDPGAKEKLAFEAKALSESKDERFVTLSAKIFTFLGDKKKSEDINNSIVKRFPKGNKARIEGYDKIVKSKLSGESAEKEYKLWLKKFPENDSNGSNEAVYTQAIIAVAQAYLRENKIDQANVYIDLAIQRGDFAQYANWTGTKLLEEKNYLAAEIILQKGYEIALNASQSISPEIKTSNNAKSYFILALNYSKVLEVQKNDYVLAGVLNTLVNSPFGGTSANAVRLGNAYLNQGKKLDAFMAWNNYLHLPNVQGKDEKIISLMKPLYNELNGEHGEFDSYIASIRSNVDNNLTSKFKSQMIKKKAPDFSFTDKSGKVISLSDLKGKIVVLEFWATWCSPCKRSLPGMQSLVNKYKNDKDVEFLFVNVFQKEKNFKEVVDKYLIENHYSFNVIFDDMNNPEVSTARAYGVHGIPHKVVIDKEGYIRFEGTGDLAEPEKTVNEISAKIELTRKSS